MNTLKSFVLTIFLFSTTLFLSAKEAYNISITVKGYPNKLFYLGYYYGDKQYLRDSARTDAAGKMVFKGDRALEGGIYLVATDNKSLLFDFVVTEQFFSLETDSVDVIANMKVKGSKENDIFFDYTKFTARVGRQAQEYEKKLNEAKGKKDTAGERKSTESLRGALNELSSYRKNTLSQYPDALISKIFRMMKEVDVPEPPKRANGSIDSNFQYNYYYHHYFDNFDFADDRITRTPVFNPKFETFMKKMTIQFPDSINKSADMVLALAKNGKENFKYCLYWITNYYESSEYMGMDAVFVHMIDKYYATGKAYWVDSTLLYKLMNKADMERNNLIGRRAVNLSLPDTANKYHTLFNIDAKYTLLLFWDATCGHCKEEVPKILTAFNDFNKTTSVKQKKFFDVFAVSSTPNPEDWKKYMRENKIKWTNVYDPYNESNFHRVYDVTSTPVIYILDENKKIIAKRLSGGQVKDFIENYEKDKENMPPIYNDVAPVEH